MYLSVGKLYQIHMHDSMQCSLFLLLYLLSFSVCLLYTAPGKVRDLKVQVKDENKMSVLTWKKPKNGVKLITTEWSILEMIENSNMLVV